MPCVRNVPRAHPYGVTWAVRGSDRADGRQGRPRISQETVNSQLLTTLRQYQAVSTLSAALVIDRIENLVDDKKRDFPRVGSCKSGDLKEVGSNSSITIPCFDHKRFRLFRNPHADPWAGNLCIDLTLPSTPLLDHVGGSLLDGHLHLMPPSSATPAFRQNSGPYPSEGRGTEYDRGYAAIWFDQETWIGPERNPHPTQWRTKHPFCGDLPSKMKEHP